MNLVKKYSERLVQEEGKTLVIVDFLCEYYSQQYTRDFYDAINGFVKLYGADEVFLVAISIAGRYRRFRGSFHKAIEGLLAKILHSNTQTHLDKSLLLDLSEDIRAFVQKVEDVKLHPRQEEIIRILFDD